MAEESGTPTEATSTPKKKVSQRITDQFIGSKVDSEKAKLEAQKAQLANLESQLGGFQEKAKNQTEVGQFEQDFGLMVKSQEDQIARMRQSIADTQGRIASPSELLEGKERDLVKGAQFGESVLGEEGLGRLGTDPEIQAAIERTKRESEQGLSSEEFAAQRSKAYEGIDRSTQTAARGALARLARLGVKGATGGQQIAQIEQAGQASKAGIERDIFLKSADVQRQAFSDFKQSLGDVKSFDIGQKARETDIALQSGLGFAQLGSAEKIAELQAEAQKQAAAARASANSCWAAGTHVVMQYGGIKAIEKLELGDLTKFGKVEGLTKHLVPSEVLVSIDEIIVVGSHPINEVGTWIESKDSALAVSVESDIEEVVVYDIIVPGNRVAVYSNGHEYLFTDYNGHDMQEENDRLLEELNNVEGISEREVR